MEQKQIVSFLLDHNVLDTKQCFIAGEGFGKTQNVPNHHGRSAQQTQTGKCSRSPSCFDLSECYVCGLKHLSAQIAEQETTFDSLQFAFHTHFELEEMLEKLKKLL